MSHAPDLEYTDAHSAGKCFAVFMAWGTIVLPNAKLCLIQLCVLTTAKGDTICCSICIPGPRHSNVSRLLRNDVDLCVPGHGPDSNFGPVVQVSRSPGESQTQLGLP